MQQLEKKVCEVFFCQQYLYNIISNKIRTNVSAGEPLRSFMCCFKHRMMNLYLYLFIFVFIIIYFYTIKTTFLGEKNRAKTFHV